MNIKIYFLLFVFLYEFFYLFVFLSVCLSPSYMPIDMFQWTFCLVFQTTNIFFAKKATYIAAWLPVALSSAKNS